MRRPKKTVTIDLSSYLSAGTYNVKVKSKGTDIRDSADSNSVECVVAASGYTLIVSGVYENSYFAQDTGGSIIVDNTTCSVESNGSTTNIPHTFNDISSFTVTNGYYCAGELKIISGTGTYYNGAMSYSAGTTITFQDDNDLQFVLTSDTVVQLAYYND